MTTPKGLNLLIYAPVATLRGRVPPEQARPVDARIALSFPLAGRWYPGPGRGDGWGGARQRSVDRRHASDSLDLGFLEFRPWRHPHPALRATFPAPAGEGGGCMKEVLR